MRKTKTMAGYNPHWIKLKEKIRGEKRHLIEKEIERWNEKEEGVRVNRKRKREKGAAAAKT